jgi:phage-related minor tail protein
VALGDLFNPILAAIKRALGPFGKLFDLLGKFWDRLKKLPGRIDELVRLIRTEITEWRNFKEDIAFRTGVINIPKAVEKTRQLIEEVVNARDAVIDLFNQIKEKLQTTGGNPAQEAEDAIKDIESSGLRDILSKFPRLLKGAEKILGFIAVITDALETILDALDDLIKIVKAIRDLREEIEHGATIFLQQKNPRKALALKEGGSIKVRLGNLHS